MLKLNDVKDYLWILQQQLCHELATIDGSRQFLEDRWQRPDGGGGCTRILENGAVFEKAGVNFSHVWGHELPVAATKGRAELVGSAFEAMGISLVLHPRNPYIPTVHANLRIFVASPAHAPQVWWFGGGFDLTPYYGFVEDCVHWHQTACNACLPFGESIYPRFKQWADDYFYLPHRQEWRGIGGLFFDDLNHWEFPQCFAFMQSIGNHFLSAYVPILQRRRDHPYGAREREFQNYRRGRYVEFNLIYDRGTLFGLQSGGRIESILMSLPPQAHWRYNYDELELQAESPEEKLLTFFLKPRDWCNSPLL